MSRLLKCLSVATLLLLLTGQGKLFAQQAVPGSADPGRIEKRFEQPALPKSVAEPVVPESPEQVPPEEAEKIKLTLSAVVIDGSTVYSENDLKPFYEDLLGKEISLADVYKIAEKITAKYGNDGYALSRAVVPAQRIREGIIKITIIEGFIDKVLIEGDAGGNADLIRAYADKIVGVKPLTANVLERYLLLANDLPGASVKSVIRPSEANHGASTLVFVTEYKPVGATASIDNRGSRTSGPLEETFGVSGNALLGMSEKSDLRFIRAGNNELRYWTLSHQEMLGSEGTKLSLSANRSRSTPGYNLKNLEMRSRGFTGEIDLSHPFIRTRASSLSVHAALAYKNTLSQQLHETSSEDRLRVFKFGASYDYADPWGGSNLLSADLHKGLNVLSPTKRGRDLLSRSLGRSDFLKFTADYTRTQPLWDNFSLLAGVTGQKSAHNLLAGEEFGFGGSSFGRAYDSSEITGDSGIAAKLELQYTQSFPDWQIKYLQPYVFWDIGKVKQKTPLEAEKHSEAAASAGLGLRFGVTDYLSGSGEFSTPLTHDVAAKAPNAARDTRFFFSMTANY
ncbi:MAG: ShlB/FhaC/HecB family hemolysin secretion/activation protein [Rhodospirillales bacterium]|nr:ShlB/FhaC/HecB family hemolysin secretion/activation protein [Rhodospirillales bacterium]